MPEQERMPSPAFLEAGLLYAFSKARSGDSPLCVMAHIAMTHKCVMAQRIHLATAVLGRRDASAVFVENFKKPA
jgi:hypothetical protein